MERRTKGYRRAPWLSGKGRRSAATHCGSRACPRRRGTRCAPSHAGALSCPTYSSPPRSSPSPPSPRAAPIWRPAKPARNLCTASSPPPSSPTLPSSAASSPRSASRSLERLWTTPLTVASSVYSARCSSPSSRACRSGSPIRHGSPWPFCRPSTDSCTWSRSWPSTPTCRIWGGWSARARWRGTRLCTLCASSGPRRPISC
mmetsp:Transcript_46905/g.142090  ORF Transcript_46905/g.142090 Transcript_46905/m.142090 type:complete len:202 (+) Transcript_46905:354-959(+)